MLLVSLAILRGTVQRREKRRVHNNFNIFTWPILLSECVAPLCVSCKNLGYKICSPAFHMWQHHVPVCDVKGRTCN
jgi:hypothetical protein